jgi:hypothetical protein
LVLGYKESEERVEIDGPTERSIAGGDELGLSLRGMVAVDALGRGGEANRCCER